ncbi:response regulator transcription factor [Inquilinus sp. OTU3971]|uniref:response regulator transcription factor n=1 Tax=Inquilinus sp. OTU3971 TaxID=3043855 RepID=UPI00313BA365
MIAYRNSQSASTCDIVHEESLPNSQAVHEANLSAHGAAKALSLTRPDNGSSLISIIDPRTLGRDSLARALEAPEHGFRSQAFACLNEWLRNDQIRSDTAAILLGIGATDADDPGLAEDLQLLAREFSHIPAIVMGDIEDQSHVLGILSHGARGYIPTSVSLVVAIQAISLARAGGLFVPASSLMQSKQKPVEGSRTSLPVNQLLTARQAAVADGVARGKANKVIAYELNLCVSTVKVHIRGIMKKLQARNRTEVAFKLHNLETRRIAPVPAWPSGMNA